ncbi:MAG TPA: energy transducer TonB [Flavobacteriaceae bacterium]|nr:energy transducer TonB [Flavobacteriaceae bacterium]
MKPKKNPKADLSNKSILFTQIGLIIVLFLAWQAIELKTYDKSDLDTGIVDINALQEEDVPITSMNTPPPPPPPPPPPAPEVLEVVEDEAEVEEVEIQSTETNQEEIIDVQEVQEVAPVEEIAQVPFAVIENVPVFPGCEKYSSNEERKQCMSEKVQKFVNKNFDTDLAQDLGLSSGTNRIQVLFKIDSKGNVVDVKARATHPRLVQEAKRVIEKLPHMQPGKQRGKAVEVLYSLPIIFQVQ